MMVTLDMSAPDDRDATREGGTTDGPVVSPSPPEPVDPASCQTREARRDQLLGEISKLEEQLDAGKLEGQEFLATVEALQGQLAQLGPQVTPAVNLPEVNLPPTDVHDASGWDRYWDQEIREGFFVHEGFTPPPGLQELMLRRRLRTVLCAGNGLSTEPLILAGTGFRVTAVDLSLVATEFCQARRGRARRIARRCAVRWLVGTRFGYPSFFRGRTRLACRILLGWPRGRVDFVQGDILDPAVCPGPFDVVIERNMLHLFPEPERPVVLERLVARLAPRGVFASAYHTNCWNAARAREALAITGTWLREHGFTRYEWWPPHAPGGDVTRAERLAILFMCTG